MLESIFNKVADFQYQVYNFNKEETPAQFFSCEFKNAFFIELLRVTASVTSTFLKYDF